MHENCLKCGLFSSLREPENMALGFPTRNYEFEQVDILVVISKGFEDNCQDLVMDPKSQPAKMLVHYLELSGHSYDFLGTTLCLVNNPSNRQVKACSPLRRDVIAAYNPKVVVCFGSDAITATIPGGGSISGLKDTVTQVEYPHGITPTLVTYHPNLHFSTGKSQRDLTGEYSVLFQRIDKILSGEDIDRPHEELLVLSDTLPGKAIEIVIDHIGKSERGTVADDIEYGVNEKNPVARTMWHLDTPIICDAFSTYYAGNYQTVVVDTRHWRSHHFASLLDKAGRVAREKDLTFWGSNYKTDMTKKMIEAGFFRRRPPDISFFEMLSILRSCFPKWGDSLMVGWLNDQASIGNGLKQLAYTQLGAKNWSKAYYDELDALQKVNPLADFRDMDILKTMRYCGHDGWRQCQLADEIMPAWIEPIRQPYDDLRRITEDLIVTEWVGLPVDLQYFEEQEILLRHEISGYQAWLDVHPYTQHMGWKEFNVKSPQKKSNLAEALGLDKVITARTPSGMVKIDKKTIPLLIGDRSEPPQQFWGVVEDVRQLRDRSDKFFGLLTRGTSPDGFYHPDFKVVKSEKSTGTAGGDDAEEGTSGTETGRLGCTLHILPKKDKVILSGIYVPGNTGTLITADLKSIEPMVNGYLSRCKALMDMFKFGKLNPGSVRGDVYITTCAGLLTALGTPTEPEDITEEQRTWTKPIWLGSSYDQSPYALSKVLGCTYEEATKILHAMMHVTYPELLRRSDGIRKSVLKNEDQITIFGRRRSFDLMVDYSVRYPDTINSDRPMLLYELEEAMLAEDKAKGREAPFKSKFGRPLAMLGTDSHTLREATNFLTQEPGNAINLAAKAYIGEQIDYAKLYSNLAVHDSIKFLSYSKGDQLFEEMRFIRESMTTPDRYLRKDTVETLGWNDFNPLQVEIVYGPNAAEMEVFHG